VPARAAFAPSAERRRDAASGGNGSAGRRIGVSASGKAAFRHGYNDQEKNQVGFLPGFVSDAGLGGNFGEESANSA
jgi:hypothetical protein